jgi:NADH dehydrogenase
VSPIPIHYDYLIVATGTRHSYFSHPEWEKWAPGLKSIEDARRIRKRFLLAFERAEWEEDPVARAALLTFIIVGGGPTGVELAGVLPEMCKRAFRPDFRRIDTAKVRVILLEGGPRILPSSPESLSDRAKRDLEKPRCGGPHSTRIVTGIDEEGVDDRRRAHPLAIGVLGGGQRGLAARQGARRHRSSARARAPARPRSLRPRRPARVRGRRSRGGEAPVEGRDACACRGAGREPDGAARSAEHPTASSVARRAQPFRYTNKGELATIGRHHAVASLGGGKLIRITGSIAWSFWLFIHIMYLVGFRNRISVLLQWAYNYRLLGARRAVDHGDRGREHEPGIPR